MLFILEGRREFEGLVVGVSVGLMPPAAFELGDAGFWGWSKASSRIFFAGVDGGIEIDDERFDF